MKKKADLDNFFKDYTPNATPAPAPKAAPTAPAAAPKAAPAPTAAPGEPTAPRPGGQSLPFSEEVKRMQNALLTIASELNIRHGKDNPNPALTKKIQDISRHVAGQGTAYGDGRWGANTQNALNSLYDFVAELVKHMDEKTKPKYEALLKEMENAGVGPGKKFEDIGKNVNQAASTLYNNIRTIIENWGDDIEKAMTAQKTSGDAPGGEKPPTGQAGQVAAPSGHAAPGTAEQGVIPVGLKQEVPQGQQAAPGGQAGPAAGISDFPFDLTTDVISMQNFQAFLQQVFSLRNFPAFQKQVGTYIEALMSQAQAATQTISNWLQYARGNGSVDGFSLAIATNTDDLVNTNFNHNYVTARNMLNMLSEICSRLAYILEMLRRTRMFDDDILREQAQRGTDYTQRISSMVNKIESLLRSGKVPAYAPPGGVAQRP